MKNKFIFVLAVFLIYSMSVTAQLPNQLSTNHTSLNKQIVNSTANLLQNTAGNYNIFNESKYSTFDDSSLLNKLSANCNKPDSDFAPEAAACNGVSVTAINFSNTNRTIVSGAANTPGVIFRYPNVGTAPDGTVLDSLVTVVSYNNNQDSTPANFRDADTTAAGFDGNLQPSLEPENDRYSANNARWIGNMTYRIQFVRTGTTTPVIISVAATTIDNDGSTACGGLNEAVTYSTGFNQILVSNPTTQTIAGNLVTGPQTVQAGIGTGNNYAASTLYINVSELNWTYSFSSAGNCTQNGTSEDRFGSLNLSCQINFGQNFTSVALSGTVFNDTNGLSDSTVNGTGNNAGGLFANLLDGNGNVVSSVAVAANGTYSFPVVVSGSYNVQISTNQGVESSPAPVSALPAGWVNTGENLGAGAGNDGSVNGLLPITVAAAAITNANFGIEQRPTAANNSAPSQTNPGGTTSVTVPAATFSATDTAPGTVSNIRITAFPSNATTITINGTTYTSATFPVGGVTVPTNAAGNPTQTISVDPINGAVTVGIPYVAIDNAGVESSTAGTASVPFGTVGISGNVLNDTNGLTDSTVNGTGTNAGGLFANLLNSSGNVVATVAIPAGGTYSFTGLDSGSYTVQVSTNAGTVGNPAPATALPTGWVNTGENIGTAAGNDGTPNGLLPVVLGAASVTNANFGIEQRPVAANNTAPSQINPGGTNNATVPAATFSATDTAPGTVSNIRITAFPSNATSITINGTTYTSATFPVGGVTVPTNAAGNPTQTITVDPVNGATTVGIQYVAIDNAGVESSAPATASVPFTTVALSGNVFNDTNGLTDSTVNGTGTNAGGLFANLLDSGGNVVASVAVGAGGAYSFASVGAGSYTVQVSTNAGTVGNPAPATALPTGWVNTGENIGTAAGNDGTPNGLLPVTITTAAVTNANFGIEQRPTANNNTAASQTNPGGTNNATVPATTFTGTDPGTATVTNIRITAFPSNATTITINGTQYTSGTFPGGGVTVPTNAAGNPTQPILVDPLDGAVTVGIPYVTLDAANIASSTTATASVPFAPVSISGTILNDTNGLTDSTVNGSGTNTGASLYANLLDNNGNVLQSVLIPADGKYTFAGLNSGSYTVQVSTNQGTIGNPAPVSALPAGWVNTGENIGTAAGNDGTPNGRLPVVIGTTPTNITDANLGIEQRPTANNNTASTQTNPNGTNNATVPSTTFFATDPSSGTVSSIRITAFPSNATSITINGTQYTSGTFPGGGVIVPTNASGNPTQPILVDPFDGTVTVGIPYVAKDNAGVESATPAMAGVPFAPPASAAVVNLSGTLRLNENPIPNALILLIDAVSGSKAIVRTDVSGNYLFDEVEIGNTYIVQPLSSKFSFNPGSEIITLFEDSNGLDFSGLPKNYHPKNDFDGDGQSDAVVFRQSEGNWYVRKSSDGEMSVYKFGLEGDIPVSADFDGDGKTDYAVFRPSDGFWYIKESGNGNIRYEKFGAADDKLLPADFDGDGKADLAVYRDGLWYIVQSSNGTLVIKNFGLSTDIPLTADFDGDGKTDLTVYRKSDQVWYSQPSQGNSLVATKFGLATDVPVTGDFDGEGFADIGQFRNGVWFVQNSTTGFEASQFGIAEDQSIVGDYDGDGRADKSVFRNGMWLIYRSGTGSVEQFYFGLPKDILVK